MRRGPWKPRMLPPMWVAVGVAALFALHRWMPGPELMDGPLRLGGVAVVVAGALFALWGERQFARAGTGIIPGSEVTAFVRTGPFRITRNPMYVGMTAALLGAAWLFGTATGFAVPFVFAVIIDRRFIRHEERMLRERFGEEAWREYASTTRRWL